MSRAHRRKIREKVERRKKWKRLSGYMRHRYPELMKVMNDAPRYAGGDFHLPDLRGKNDPQEDAEPQVLG